MNKSGDQEKCLRRQQQSGEGPAESQTLGLTIGS